MHKLNNSLNNSSPQHNNGYTSIISLQDVLNPTGSGGKRPRWAWQGWLALALLVIAGSIGWYFLNTPSASQSLSFRTEALQRGTLKLSITATGKLKPLNQVDISTELSGTLNAVRVNVNDTVKRGQELASLNTTQLNDAIIKSKAALVSAEARVQQAAATVIEARANLQRLRQLHTASAGKLPSQLDMDTAIATLKRAQADAAVSNSSITSVNAELRSATTDLSKASILSPIDGVVLKRSAEVGQTVASSFSSPTLFTLAEDLAKMELEVNVDEADVAQVKQGQAAVFSVDAWAGREYPARVQRVNLGAGESDSNVVSYPTVLAVANADLSLRPGMTATATIITQTSADALLVPNAALRFTPASVDTANTALPAAAPSGGLLAKLLPTAPPRPSNQAPPVVADGLPEGQQQVWVLANNQPTPVTLTTGMTDGEYTAMVSGNLSAGMQVITDSTTLAEASR